MTIRIDTFRRQLDAQRGLIDLAAQHAADLHDLAYTRPRRETIKVSGGQPDYALDTHGDTDARAILHDIQQATLDAIERTHPSLIAAADLLNRRGHTGGRRDRTADATILEVHDALAALGRRRARGDHTPTVVDQPPVRTPDPHHELELVQSAIRKQLDPQRLTPAEKDAVRRARGQETSRRKKGKRAS